MSLAGILIDLDGTMIDSAPVVTEALAEMAKEDFGLDQAPEAYRKYVGPPLTWTMADLGAKPDEIPQAIERYRLRYNERKYESLPFEGIPACLEQLSQVAPLVVATSKKESAAKDLLEHHGIAQYFTAICGASEDERHSAKADIIAEALTHLSDGDVVMVGDRKYDVEGAQVHGLPTILVDWGQAPEEERQQAWKTVATPDELVALIRTL